MQIANSQSSPSLLSLARSLLLALLTTLTMCAQSQQTEKYEANRPVKFEKTLAGSMSHKGATSVSFQGYKSEDGVMLDSRIETYKSPDAAKSEFQKYVNRATKVIQTNTKLDQRGRPVGQRAVLLFAKAKQAPTGAAVLWTEGSDLHILESPSLPNVLAFESQFHNQDPSQTNK